MAVKGEEDSEDSRKYWYANRKRMLGIWDLPEGTPPRETEGSTSFILYVLSPWNTQNIFKNLISSHNHTDIEKKYLSLGFKKQISSGDRHIQGFTIIHSFNKHYVEYLVCIKEHQIREKVTNSRQRTHLEKIRSLSWKAMELVSLEKESHSAVAAMENSGHRGPQKDRRTPPTVHPEEPPFPVPGWCTRRPLSLTLVCVSSSNSSTDHKQPESSCHPSVGLLGCLWAFFFITSVVRIRPVAVHLQHPCYGSKTRNFSKHQKLCIYSMRILGLVNLCNCY